ncbi:MAG TPA: glucose 1-dehydrogenase [Planctomycetaceae bacterium]|nr:glucose 1-dehydrogenase [Planctomycetaceae bacterium]
MKAIAVKPRQPHSVHLAELPKPKVSDVPNGRGVLVKVLKVGVDATDREIDEGLYGAPPPGYDFLVIGHESFGIVQEVGPNVRHVKPGDYVTCTVRRPGSSIFDRIGRSDITSEETYYERGINLLHGYMTEYFVDDAEFVVLMPASIKHLHVLAEPMSVAAKAVQQAYEAQRRLQVWNPRVAYVTGAGQIGLLTTLILRLRGVEVYTIARAAKPNLKAEIAAGLGATYISSRETPLAELAKQTGKPDLIIEATGSSAIAFECMSVLNLNGAMVWTSITGGQKKTEVFSDKINLEWVLGNKLLLGSVNANFRHFELGIADLAQGEIVYPGVIRKILTHPVNGLDSYQEVIRLLTEDKQALKVFVNVAEG